MAKPILLSFTVKSSYNRWIDDENENYYDKNSSAIIYPV